MKFWTSWDTLSTITRIFLYLCFPISNINRELIFNTNTMRLKTILLTALMVLSLAGTAFAQQNIKIGYANIEAILLYMPETKSMNQQGTKAGYEQGELLLNSDGTQRLGPKNYLPHTSICRP